MVLVRDKNGSPDMIMTAFDGKFDDKKDEIPPGACRPPNKLKENNVDKVDHQKVGKKNNVEQVGPKKLKKNNVDKESIYSYKYI